LRFECCDVGTGHAAGDVRQLRRHT
jgi:hypothetical protein